MSEGCFSSMFFFWWPLTPNVLFMYTFTVYMCKSPQIQMNRLGWFNQHTNIPWLIMYYRLLYCPFTKNGSQHFHTLTVKQNSEWVCMCVCVLSWVWGELVVVWLSQHIIRNPISRKKCISLAGKPYAVFQRKNSSHIDWGLNVLMWLGGRKQVGPNNPPGQHIVPSPFKWWRDGIGRRSGTGCQSVPQACCPTPGALEKAQTLCCWPPGQKVKGFHKEHKRS